MRLFQKLIPVIDAEITPETVYEAIQELANDQATAIGRFKTMVYTDIMQNGIPLAHFSDVTIKFKGELWTFKLDTLKELDLCRFTPDMDDALVGVNNVHALNLAKFHMLLPDINGRLYKASHAAASLLLTEYFAAHRRYIEARNLLFEFIDTAVIEEATMAGFIYTVYRTMQFGDEPRRIKLS